MISIDHNAYYSSLRKIDPIIKLITSITAIFISLFSNSYLISSIIIITFSWIIVKYGDTKFKFLLKLIALPISFLILSIITIIIQRAESPSNLLMTIKIWNLYYGIGLDSIDFVGRIIFRAISTITCMYFIALTTPMTEFLHSLRRLKFPKLIVELMELIYRFIFVLTDTANQIYIAQSSRLGYNGLKASYKSLGILVSMLFLRAYKRSDRLYIALDSRGYDGELNMIEFEYERKLKYYLYSSFFIAILIIISLVERLVLK